VEEFLIPTSLLANSGIRYTAPPRTTYLIPRGVERHRVLCKYTRFGRYTNYTFFTYPDRPTVRLYGPLRTYTEGPISDVRTERNDKGQTPYPTRLHSTRSVCVRGNRIKIAWYGARYQRTLRSRAFHAFHAFHASMIGIIRKRGPFYWEPSRAVARAVSTFEHCRIVVCSCQQRKVDDRCCYRWSANPSPS
jgi:hypothetical protein